LALIPERKNAENSLIEKCNQGVVRRKEGLKNEKWRKGKKTGKGRFPPLRARLQCSQKGETRKKSLGKGKGKMAGQRKTGSTAY